MLYFKSCLRCKDGTVELGSDNFGTFLNCLTCGYTINSRSIRSNGSIEQPTTLPDDVVPTPAKGFGLVAMADKLTSGGGADEVDDDFGPGQDISLFDDDMDDLVVEIEAAAI